MPRPHGQTYFFGLLESRVTSLLCLSAFCGGILLFTDVTRTSLFRSSLAGDSPRESAGQPQQRTAQQLSVRVSQASNKKYINIYGVTAQRMSELLAKFPNCTLFVPRWRLHGIIA
ncbi:unnamed protein product [Polarella glacialis]|uniref:Uncharacterized protein n=1 Tax=Polarella glacialis TaxID=89957 RepID=A0A813JJX9_POLGL|nr:unnamed protein product [Polarella glacialis]